MAQRRTHCRVSLRCKQNRICKKVLNSHQQLSPLFNPLPTELSSPRAWALAIMTISSSSERFAFWGKRGAGSPQHSSVQEHFLQKSKALKRWSKEVKKEENPTSAPKHCRWKASLSLLSFIHPSFHKPQYCGHKIEFHCSSKYIPHHPVHMYLLCCEVWSHFHWV